MWECDGLSIQLRALVDVISPWNSRNTPSLYLSLFLSLFLSLSFFLSLFLSRSPLSLCLAVCLYLFSLSLSLSISLSLRLRLLCLSLFQAPINSLSITGGRLMRLKKACMWLLTNLKPVFIARGILLHFSSYFLCQWKYFLTFFLPFWIVRDSSSLSFCACHSV